MSARPSASNHPFDLRPADPAWWPAADPEIAHRFAAKVLVPAAPGACWIWVGAIESTAGYGRFQEGRGRGATVTSPHRWSWVHARPGRRLPKGVVARHTCDIRLCVNYVDHLVDGSVADNVADAVRRGRATRISYDPQRYVRISRELRTAALAGDLDTVQRILTPPQQLDLFAHHA